MPKESSSSPSILKIPGFSVEEKDYLLQKKECAR
jgi:hypothetical protein